MAVIFCGSADAGSSKRSSRIIGPLLIWLKPDISEATLDHVIFAVRKGAHVSEYALLAILLWRARSQPAMKSRRLASVSLARWVLAVSVLYAASDEWHQSLVPNRDGRVADVIIDAAGAIMGTTLAWVYTRRRHRNFELVGNNINKDP